MIKVIKKHNLSGYTEVIADLGIKAFCKFSELQKVDHFELMEEIFFCCLDLKLHDWSHYFLCLIKSFINGSTKAYRYNAMFRES